METALFLLFLFWLWKAELKAWLVSAIVEAHKQIKQVE